MSAFYSDKPETYISILQDRLANVGKQSGSETIQIADARHDYQDAGFEITEAMKSIDSEIIRRAEELGNYISEKAMQYDNVMKNTWVWNPGKIAAGTFPLADIPEHIRGLAQGLYYD